MANSDRRKTSRLAGGLNRSSASRVGGLRNFSRAQGEGRRRNIRTQGAAWQRDLRQQGIDKQFRAEELDLRKQGLAQQAEQAGLGREHALGLLQKQQDFAQGQAGLGREHAAGILEKQQAHSTGLAEARRTHAAGILEKQQAHSAEQAGLGRAQQATIAGVAQQGQSERQDKDIAARAKAQGRTIQAQRDIEGARLKASGFAIDRKSSAENKKAWNIARSKIKDAMTTTKRSLARAQKDADEDEIKALTGLLQEQGAEFEGLGSKPPAMPARKQKAQPSLRLPSAPAPAPAPTETQGLRQRPASRSTTKFSDTAGLGGRQAARNQIEATRQTPAPAPAPAPQVAPTTSLTSAGTPFTGPRPSLRPDIIVPEDPKTAQNADSFFAYKQANPDATPEDYLAYQEQQNDLPTIPDWMTERQFNIGYADYTTRNPGASKTDYLKSLTGK